MIKKDFKKKVLCGTCFVLALFVTDAFAKTTAVINPTPSRTTVHAQEITDRTYLDNVEAALDIHNFVQSRINPRLMEHDSTKNAKVDNALNEKRSATCDTCNQALLSPYMTNPDEVWEKLKELSDAGYETVAAEEENDTEKSTNVEDYLGIWDMGHEILMGLYKDMDAWEGGLPKRIRYSFKLWDEQKALYDEKEWDPKYIKINQDIAAQIGTSCIIVEENRHKEGDKRINYSNYEYSEFVETYHSGVKYDYYHHDGAFMTAHNDYLTAIEVEYNDKWKSIREEYLQKVYNETYAQVKSELEGQTCTRTVSCPGGSCCGSSGGSGSGSGTGTGSGSGSGGSSSLGTNTGSGGTPVSGVSVRYGRTKSVFAASGSGSEGGSGSGNTEPTSCEETYACPDPDAASKAEEAATAARNKADQDGSADEAANAKCPLYEYKVPEEMRTDEEVYVPIEQPRPLPPVEETVIQVNGRLYPEDPVLWTYKGTDYKWSENGGSYSEAGELQNNRLSRYVMLEEEKKMSDELLELHQATDLLIIAETITMAQEYGIDLNDEEGDPILSVAEDLFLISGNSCGVEDDTDPSKEVDRTEVEVGSCDGCDTLGQEEGSEEEEEIGKCDTEEGNGEVVFDVAFDYDAYADARFNTDQFDKMTELNKENLTEVKERFLAAKASQIQDAEEKIEFFHMDEHTPVEVSEARQTMSALKQDKDAKTLLTYNNPAEPLNYTYTYEGQEQNTTYGKEDIQKEQKAEYNDAFEQYEELMAGLDTLINEQRKQLRDTWTERMGPMDSDCLQEGIEGDFPEGEQAIADLNREIKE